MYNKLITIENKARLLGISFESLNDSGLVVHKSSTEDLLYLSFRDKPLSISKQDCIPEYTEVNGVVIVRYAKKFMSGSYKTYIKLYGKHYDRPIIFEEIQYLSPFEFSGTKLPNRTFSISGSAGCDAVLLKLKSVKHSYNKRCSEKTYVISGYGYRKQISNKYICVANAGWDDSFHRKLVLLMLGRNASQFSDVDNLHYVHQVYLDNNYINDAFTEYKLLSPSDKVIEK